MRICLLGDFDTFLFRGLERPLSQSYYRLSPGLNLARGFRDLGVKDVHYLVVTAEVHKHTIDEGPFGTLHRLPCPPLSGSACFFLWRRHLLHSALSEIRPNIVHGQGTEREYGFAAVTSRYPNLVTLHGILNRIHKITPPPFFAPEHIPRWLENYVVHQAKDIICLSRESERFLSECESPARTHLIPNAVAPCFFDVQQENRTRKDKTILFVGNIYPLKGLAHLIDALAIVLNNLGPDIVLRVIGGKSIGEGEPIYQKILRERAAKMGLSEHIEWLGIQREKGIAAALEETDVLVLPSLQETAPMCIAEAMAAGVPVVATRVGGIPDLVEHEETGLLVSPGNAEELANGLCNLLSSPEMRKRLGDAGRAKALVQYEPQVVARATLEVYKLIGEEKLPAVR